MIRELKTLIAVAREGTFAAAAHRVGLTQAAVSAQMQRLEAELGFELFDRTGRAAHLNGRGQEMLLKAQTLVQMYNELGHSSPGVPASTLLTIGAIVSIQRNVLPDALARFHTQFAQCRTRIVPGVSMALVDLVDAGEIDMAAIIRPPFSLHSDLTWTALASEPYCLIVPQSVPGDDWLTLLSTQPFIRYDRTSFGGRQVERFLKHMHLRPRELCELDEQEAIVKLVAKGVGVALVPHIHGTAWPGSVRALALGVHTFHRDVGLVHRASARLNPQVDALAALIVEAASLTR